MVLRPLLISRLAPLLVLAALWIASSAGGGWDQVGFGSRLAVLVAGGYFAVRAYQARVECAADSVTIHGYLVTRRIPRAAIVDLRGGYWPRLRWRSATGEPRRSLVSPFTAGSVTTPFLAAHNERSLARLADCIGTSVNDAPR